MSTQVVGALIGLGGALVGALLVGVVTLVTHQQSERRQSVQEFREILEKLFDARIHGDHVAHDPALDPDRRNSLAITVNSKRQVLLSVASRLAESIMPRLSANDLITLGYEYQQDSDFAHAQRYFHRALDALGDNRFERGTVYRTLGWFYFMKTPYHERAKGDEYYQAALDVTKDSTDEYSHYLTGLTHENWGRAMAVGGYVGWQEHLVLARRHFLKLTTPRPLRDPAIERIDRALAAGQEAAAVPIGPSEDPAVEESRDRHG